MKRVLPLYHYLILDAGKAVGIYFAVVLLSIAFPTIFQRLTFEYSANSGLISMVDVATPIFLFVLGLNSFRSSFLFAAGNGYTRRQYHRAAALMLLTAGTVVSLVDSGVYALINSVWPGVFARWPYVFPRVNAVALESWRWAFNLVVAAAGLCITTAFYRLGPAGKVWLALVPSLLFVLVMFSLLSPIREIKFIYVLFFTAAAMLSGIGPQPNALLGAGSMFVIVLLLFGLARLLIRGAPVKEQDR